MTFFWLIAWICLSISDFFAEYLDFVFTMGGKFEKSHGGAPPDPRGGAPASVRRLSMLLGQKIRRYAYDSHVYAYILNLYHYDKDYLPYCSFPTAFNIHSYLISKPIFNAV